MYLQLADDGSENYDKLRTDQGDLYIRKDLSAGGKGAKFISKASGVLGKVAQFAPIPGASAISKGLTTISGVTGKIGTSKLPVNSPLLKPMQNLPFFPKPKATATATAIKPKATATMPTATMPTATMPILIEEQQSFFKKYRLPILIGGGVLLLGATLLILKKRK
jgi:hypothetical protein